MNGTNLLDNLQIPIEETPEVDVTKVPEAEKAPAPTPTAPANIPVSTEKVVEAKKQEFLKKRADAFVKEPEVSQKLPFNLNVAGAKEYILNFIVPIVGTIVSLLLLLLFIIPSWNNRSKLNTEIKQKTDLKNTLTEKKTKLDNLADLKSVFDDNLLIVNKVLSSEEKVPELLTEVDHLARTSGLEVDTLSYSLSSAGMGSSGYTVVDISLSITGTLDQFINFLKLTENASRLVMVSSYRYSAGKDGTLTISAVLKSPYQNVNSQAVTDDPIKLDINSTAFAKFITKVKSLTYYDPTKLQPVEVVETHPTEATTEGQGGAPTE